VDTCIFCGEPFGPNRPRSKEHAAPQWCGELLPNLGKAQHTQIIETVEGRAEADRGLRDPFTTVAKDVCRPCNTGWMAELEEWAKPCLAAPITGQRRVLRYWRQACVASWAVKTAMVWECLSPQNRTIPLDVLRMFHGTQRPGARQQVWIGHYIDTEPHTFQRVAAHGVGIAPLRPDVPDEAHAYLVALSVGQLAFVVYGHTFPIPQPFTMPAEFATRLIPIWPPEQEVVEWPPSDGVDYAGLEACVRSLGDPIEADTQTSDT
jgi:hypothetical protein